MLDIVVKVKVMMEVIEDIIASGRNDDDYRQCGGGKRIFYDICNPLIHLQ